MLHGVKINGIDTLSAYGLALLADIKISSPKLRETRVAIPGMDGDLNLSYALTGGPVYDNRDIAFTLFAGVNDFELEAVRSVLVNEYQGREVAVSFPTDETHFYFGVIQFGDITGYNTGRIPVRMVAGPWQIKNEETVVRESIGTTLTSIALVNETRPVVPEITVTTETSVVWNEGTYVLSAGSHKLLNICFAKGENVIQAMTTSGTGEITFVYREGIL